MVHSQRRNEFVSAPFPLALDGSEREARRRWNYSNLSLASRWNGDENKKSFNCWRRESDAVAASDWVDNLEWLRRVFLILHRDSFFFCTRKSKKIRVDKPVASPAVPLSWKHAETSSLFADEGVKVCVRKIYGFHHPCPRSNQRAASQ